MGSSGGDKLMETIRRRKLENGRLVPAEFPVYSVEEAEALGIAPVPWRKAREAGQWAVDDAGFVSEVLGAKLYELGRGRSAKVWRVTLPYGRFYVNSRLKLSFRDVLARPKPDYGEVEARKSRTKRVVRVYAKMYLERAGKLSEEDYHQLGILYRADQKLPGASVKRVLRISKVQSMVADELAKILGDAGFTRQEVLKRYNELYRDAKEAEQYSVAKGILDKLADMLDMKPDVRRISAGIQSSQSMGMLPDADWEEPFELDQPDEDE